jgi:aldehyde dehydrogenase (NAD+)
MSTSSASSQGPTTIETRLFINGSFIPSQTGKKFPVINPATEKLTASVYEAEAVDVDLAVAAAQAAFPAWSEKGAWDRAQLFFKLATLLEAANSELARLEAVSMGRPVSQYGEFLFLFLFL